MGAGHPREQVRRAISLIRSGDLVNALMTLQGRLVYFGIEGEPDICGFVPVLGVAVRLGIEVKIGKDSMSTAQEVFREQLVKNGGIYVIAKSVEQARKDLLSSIEDAKGRIKANVT